MRFVFRVDAGRTIGYGHVYRCLALADALASAGHSSTFLSREHVGHLSEIIRGRGHDVVLLPSHRDTDANPRSWLGDDVGRDADATVRLAHSTHAAGVVVDHYSVGLAWTRTVQRAGFLLATIDDLADRHLTCDLLANHNLAATDLDYSKVLDGSCNLLLGPSYALLASDFLEARALRSGAPEARQGPARLLVALGGSDPVNATTTILESLARLEGHAVHLDVVIGQAHPDPRSVHELASLFASADVHVQASPNMVAHLLARADLAIGAGGSSALERMCVGVPSIVCEIAPNQRSTVQALNEARLAVPYALASEPDDRLSTIVARLLGDPAMRLRMRERAMRFVDGHGAARVAAAIIALASPTDGPVASPLAEGVSDD